MRISDWSSDVCSSDLDYGRPENAAIGHDRPRLGRPISFIDRQLETFGDEVLHFGRGRGRARADHAQAVAEKIPAHFGHYFGPDVFVIPSDATLDHLPDEVAVDHLHDAREDGQFGRSDDPD